MGGKLDMEVAQTWWIRVIQLEKPDFDIGVRPRICLREFDGRCSPQLFFFFPLIKVGELDQCIWTTKLLRW